MAREYWRKVSPAEREERNRRERDQLIAKAKARFNHKSLTDSEIWTLYNRWDLTEKEIVTHWDVYPCALNWALWRGGCGCTAVGTQFCLTAKTKGEILKILPKC